jgi:signal transduction histidine kinase/CheY-like chemotaxis protein
MAEVFHLVASDVGRRIDGFAYNLDIPELVELLGRVRASGERFESGVRHQGLSFLMRVLPYRSRGRRAGVVLTLVDVTRLEQVELTLREQVDQRDRFLAMLSHELRNPLAAISNALHLIGRRLEHPERGVADPLDIIVRQSTHMQRLLDDLLDIARLTQGKFQLRKTPLELQALLAEVIETNRTRLGAQQPSLVFAAQDSEPLWIFGDATRIVQIFDNLLSNATKYTPSGGHVTLELSRAGERAVVSVRDDGIGIDLATQSHMFDLFVQADVSLARSQGGLGVGLTLVRNLIDLHEGQIDVHSEGVGLGSEFVVRFPLVPCPVPVIADTELSAETPTGVRKPKLVVVEDRAEILETLAELLVDYGFVVSTASDGMRGFELILATLPDAALLDIGLPGLDGYELARRLRAQPSTSSVPLLAMTGYGRAEDQAKATEAGFNTHLVKPINIYDLIASLAQLGVHLAKPVS